MRSYCVCMAWHPIMDPATHPPHRYRPYMTLRAQLIIGALAPILGIISHPISLHVPIPATTSIFLANKFIVGWKKGTVGHQLIVGWKKVLMQSEILHPEHILLHNIRESQIESPEHPTPETSPFPSPRMEYSPRSNRVAQGKSSTDPLYEGLETLDGTSAVRNLSPQWLNSLTLIR